MNRLMGGQGGSAGKTLDPCYVWLILVVVCDCMGSNPAIDLAMSKNLISYSAAQLFQKPGDVLSCLWLSAG